jgi:hypothetical protein
MFHSVESKTYYCMSSSQHETQKCQTTRSTCEGAKNLQYKGGGMLNKQQNSNLRTRFQDHPHYFTNRRNFIRANIKYNVFHKGAEIIIIHQLVPENQSVGESVCERVIAGVIQY